MGTLHLLPSAADPIDPIDHLQNQLWDAVLQTATDAWHWRDETTIQDLRHLLQQVERYLVR